MNWVTGAWNWKRDELSLIWDLCFHEILMPSYLCFVLSAMFKNPTER